MGELRGSRPLGVVPPPPGLDFAPRRVGNFASFLADLIATTERSGAAGGAPLGASWDVEGDPAATRMARLWAYVAEGVAAYAELTANEAYLPTARDWGDLRRIAALVGHRPRPRMAARGWVLVDVDPGADPVLPAGTVVQAPAAPPARPAAQTFEVVADTPLRADWGGLTATWPPQPTAPAGRALRLLTDPGFAAGDRVLFVREVSPETYPGGGITAEAAAYLAAAREAVTPLGVARVEAVTDEHGTAVLTLDRDAGGFLPDSVDCAAYRIVAQAVTATHPAARLKADGSAAEAYPAAVYARALPPYLHQYAPRAGGGVDIGTTIVVDDGLGDLSPGRRIGVVDWAGLAGVVTSTNPFGVALPPIADIVPLDRVRPAAWEVAPATPVRLSELVFDRVVPTVWRHRQSAIETHRRFDVLVLGERVPLRHHRLPDAAPDPPRLRLHPAPAAPPPRVAVRTRRDGAAGWEVLECTPGPEPGLVELVTPPAGRLEHDGSSARAGANLVAVRHGRRVVATLGDGDAAIAGQRLAVPDEPVAYDTDEAGNPVPSLAVRVGGEPWAERYTLYGAGAEPVYTARLGQSGSVEAQFGDGVTGARLPTGTGNVTASYRVGGGLVGEVPDGAITVLVGAVAGVRKVTGAGPTFGGADSDDERRLRTLAPVRARVLGRAVSLGDLADLARAYSGVSHARAWQGAGPLDASGRPGGVGVHVAFLRAAGTGVRPPLPEEVAALRAYLDARRDPDVPLTVCPGALPALGLHVVAVTPHRDDRANEARAAAAVLADPTNPCASTQRDLGQPLDLSDVVAAVQRISPAIGVFGVKLPDGSLLRRLVPAPWELLAAGPDWKVDLK